MKAIILCGGMGTRIRGVADDLPKPMVPLGDRPILWHIMRWYAAHDVRHFVLCLGYKGWAIKEFFLNLHHLTSDLTVDLGSGGGVQVHDPLPEHWTVTLAETGQDTQTGGRVWAARRHLGAEDEVFCLTYGDAVADVDLDSLVCFHRQHGRVGTLTAVRPAGRFGAVEIGERDGTPLATHFEEKPQSDSGWISGGFFVFDQRLFDYLDGRPDLVLEQEPLSRMAADGELAVYRHHGFWQPMDTYREWMILNDLWSNGTAPWRPA